MDFKFQALFSTQFVLQALLLFSSAFVLNAELLVHNNNTTSKGLRQKLASGCNIYQGKWVYDSSSNPLYQSSSCPFIDSEFDCRKHGRPDSQYLKYTWKPYSCSLPRFNGAELLRKWKGKKIMLVGDSLSLNQWQSLVCMVHASVPTAKMSLVRQDPMSSATFQEYDVTISHYRSHFLVDIVRENIGSVLKLDSIQQANSWKGMDVLVFNSWHWWTHRGNSQPWSYIQDGSKISQDMDRLVAFSKGLSTWAYWVDHNVDSRKTKVFFQGISPTHYEGNEWGSGSRNCKDEQQPLSGSSYPAGMPPAAGVVNKVLKSMKTPVNLLDITTLSQLRKDAHPAVYGDPSTGTDCSHWCLPGLPDTWNQLLYAYF